MLKKGADYTRRSVSPSTGKGTEEPLALGTADFALPALGLDIDLFQSEPGRVK